MISGVEPLVELQIDQMPSLRTCLSEVYHNRRIVRLLEEDADPLRVAEDEMPLLGRADQDIRDGPKALLLAVVVGRGVR